MLKDIEMKKVEMKNCLYQRFYVIGLDSDVILKEDLYKKPFAKEITPKIISKFPPLPYSYCTIPDQLIVHHCFPEGYFLTRNKPTNQIFSFTLDNFPMQLIDDQEFKTAYFTCNLFYESLDSCYKVKEKYKNPEKKFTPSIEIKNLKNETSKDRNRDSYSKIFVPKVICLMSVLPFYIETAKILKRLLSNYSPEKSPFLIPIEKQIEDIIFSIPIPVKNLSYFVYKLQKEEISFEVSPINELPNPSNDLLILFENLEVSQIMMIFKGLLLEMPILVFCLNKEKLTNIIESLLSLLYPFTYKYPHISILPTNCFSIIEYYEAYILGVNEKYSIDFFNYNNINLETRKIFIVDMENESKRLKIVSLEQAIKSICLNVPDVGKDALVEPKLINIELPTHYTNKLVKSMTDYIHKIKASPKSNQVGKKTFNKNIRNIFFSYMFSIFRDYAKFLKLEDSKLEMFDSKYITKNLNSLNINEIFQVDAFLNANTKNLPFYQRFIKTKMFFDFIVMKIYPRTLQEKAKVLLFDERIVAKRNKNFLSTTKPTPFISNLEFCYSKPKIELKRKSNYSSEEFMLISHNITKCIEYFQDISIIGNLNPKKKKNEKVLNISYMLFPKPLYDNRYFTKSYEQTAFMSDMKTPRVSNGMMKKWNKFFDNEKNFETYKETNYKLNLYSNSEIHKLSMKKFVELAWIFLSAGTLWYCDQEERDFRIQSIFDVLENISYVEDDILIYTFLSLIQWGKDFQVIKMYEILEKYDGFAENYTLFSLLCMKMTKIFNNFKTRVKKESKPATLISRETEVNLEGEEKEVVIFRKRSLLNKKRMSDEINFETCITCPICKNDYEINFDKVLNEGINEMGESFKCPNCHLKEKSITVPMRVMVGEDESQMVQINLMTPYNLLKALRKQFINNEKFIIDIEHLWGKCPSLFYSSILYFVQCDLSYDFLIPYQKFMGAQNDDLIKFTNLKIQSCVAQLKIIIKPGHGKKRSENMDMDVFLKSKSMTAQLIRKARIHKRQDIGQKKSKEI